MIIEIKELQSWTKNSVDVGDRFVIEGKEVKVRQISKHYLHMDDGRQWPCKLFNKWIRIEKAFQRRDYDVTQPELIIKANDPVAKHVGLKTVAGKNVYYLRSLNVNTGEFERYVTEGTKIKRPAELLRSQLQKGFILTDLRTGLPFDKLKLHIELINGRPRTEVPELETQAQDTQETVEPPHLPRRHESLESRQQHI